MSGVFRNIDPPTPTPPGECVPPPLVRGEDTLAGWRGGWGVNSSEDARHCSELYTVYVSSLWIGYDFVYNRRCFNISINNCKMKTKDFRFSILRFCGMLDQWRYIEKLR